MDSSFFAEFAADIARLKVVRRGGCVVEVGAGTLTVSGLSQCAGLGDRVTIHRANGPSLGGEVITLAPDTICVLADQPPDGVAIGDRIILLGQIGIAPSNRWLGRVVDPFGEPLDGRPLFGGIEERPLKALPPAAVHRHPFGPRLSTGLCVFDTFLTLVRGQRIGLFAGSGVGKSSLLASLAKRVEADIVVIALIGERGREVRDFVEKALGPEGMKRSVIVVATSDQPAVIRRRCAWAAMAVAEHFRDQGQHVLFLADSITRFAEAHREIALTSGESPSLGGYPPSVAHQIMTLAERSGPGEGEGAGDITAILTVLVPGSDMNEPVADILRGTLDGHVILDRSISERGRFPAIDLLRSVSRSLPDAASATENALLKRGRQLLGAYDRTELMIQSGLYDAGSDHLVDQAIQVWAELDAFIGQNQPEGVEDSFAQLSHILALADQVKPVDRAKPDPLT